MYNSTLTGTGASVGYNNVETNGTGEILISDAKITAGENLNAKAIDNSRSRSYILDAGLKIVGYTGVFAYNTNTAQTGIEISNKAALSAKNINLTTQNVDYQRSSATTNKSANIKIGDSVGITTTGTQTYDAASNYDLKNDVYAEGGSLLASLRWVKSHNYITANENISVGTGATLKNEGGHLC